MTGKRGRAKRHINRLLAAISQPLHQYPTLFLKNQAYNSSIKGLFTGSGDGILII